MGELHTLEYSAQAIRTHNLVDCFGEYCTIHNMSDHSMREFPQHFRYDRGIMERICTHGIGHPDPDDYKIILGDDDGIHGCDGCCKEAE